MNKTQFWEIIDKAKESAEDLENIYHPLVTMLSQLDITNILRWQHIFDLYHDFSDKSKICAAAYVLGICTDDGFIDFRGWLIVQGKDVFLKVLKDPDSLADVGGWRGNYRFEELLYAASEAFSKKTGIKSGREFHDELDKYPMSIEERNNIISEIVYADDIDIDWNGYNVEMVKLLPKLCLLTGNFLTNHISNNAQN